MCLPLGCWVQSLPAQGVDPVSLGWTVAESERIASDERKDIVLTNERDGENLVHVES